MQSSAFRRFGVGVLILVVPFLTASLAGCGAVDPELGFTLGACDVLNCDTLFFLGLEDNHDDMPMDDDHDAMDDDHDEMADDMPMDDHDDDVDDDHDGMDDDHDDMMNDHDDVDEDALKEDGENTDETTEGSSARQS